jgi:raffinose/stachyose/melibiose transport system permease protein
MERFGRHGALLLTTVWFVVPIYLVIVNAFKTKVDILGDPLGIPVGRLTTENFQSAMGSRTFDLGYAYAFSALIALSSVAIILVFGSMISYFIARRSGRWTNRLYLLLLAGLMVPPQVVLIPVVKVLAAIGLLFTPWGLILYDSALYMPLAAFVYVGFIRTLPVELDEAAAVDGAGPLATFWRVVFPLLTPATISLFVLLIIFVWNDFVNPQILLGANQGYTVTTGIFRAIGRYQTNWGEIFAFILLASAPMLVLYLTMQRFIVGGLTKGAIKG